MGIELAIMVDERLKSIRGNREKTTAMMNRIAFTLNRDAASIFQRDFIHRIFQRNFIKCCSGKKSRWDYRHVYSSFNPNERLDEFIAIQFIATLLRNLNLSTVSRGFAFKATHRLP